MRGIALVLALAITVGHPVGAATPCAVNQWLTDLYLQSRALQDAIKDGRVDPARIRALADVLARQPGADVSLLLGQSGLQRDRADILDFIDAQNAALTGTGSARDLRDATRQMAKAVANMTCDDNPGARPGTDRFASAVIGGDPDAGARPPSRQGSRLASTLIRPAVLGLIAALLTLAGVTLGTLAVAARSRKLRRVEGRHPCTAGFHAQWKDGRRDGHFIDISRRGCKLRLDHQLHQHTKLAIDAGYLMLTGRVAWSNAHYCGVLFYHRLDDQTLKSFLKQSRAPRNRTRSRKPSATPP